MAAGNSKYTIDGYSFPGRVDYDRALKEKEAVSYITANTNMADMKAVLKVYNMSVEKKSFQTVIGLEFVNNMRKSLISSGIVSKDTLPGIPVPKIAGDIHKAEPAKSSTAGSIERYKLAYENALAGRTIRNMAIIFLILIIIAMLVITYNNKYSIFTYFTNYQEDMENEILDKYEAWQIELDKKEQELEKREKALKNK